MTLSILHKKQNNFSFCPMAKTADALPKLKFFLNRNRLNILKVPTPVLRKAWFTLKTIIWPSENILLLQFQMNLPL